MKKSWFYLLIIPLLVLGTTDVARAEVVGTDTTNDITRIAWSTNMLWSSATGQTNDKIDIKSIEWVETAQGNKSIALELVGTPVIDNETFYWVTVEYGDDFYILVWAGGYYGYDPEEPAFMSLTVGDGFYIPENAEVVIDDTKLVWTFPRTLTGFNDTSGMFEDLDIDWPDVAPSTWDWHAWAWTGQSLDEKQGVWYSDYYPEEDNIYDTENTSTNASDTTDVNNTDGENDLSDLTEMPGFEVLALGGAMIGVVALTRKRRH